MARSHPAAALHPAAAAHLCPQPGVMSIACLLGQLTQNIQTGAMAGLWQADDMQLPACLKACSGSARCCRSGAGGAAAAAEDALEGDQVELLESGKG